MLSKYVKSSPLNQSEANSAGVYVEFHLSMRKWLFAGVSFFVPFYPNCPKIHNQKFKQRGLMGAEVTYS